MATLADIYKAYQINAPNVEEIAADYNPYGWNTPWDWDEEEEEDILDPTTAYSMFGIGAGGGGDGRWIEPERPGVINPLTGKNYTLMDYIEGRVPGGKADVAATRQGIAQVDMQRKIREAERAKIANALATKDQTTEEDLFNTGVDIGIKTISPVEYSFTRPRGIDAAPTPSIVTKDPGGHHRDQPSQPSTSGGYARSGYESAPGYHWAKGGRVRYKKGGIVDLL